MRARLGGLRAGIDRLWPGLALAVAIGLGALALGAALPPVVSPVLLAVGGGLLLGSVAPAPARIAPGAAFAAQRVLRVGIVLLGARLTLSEVAQLGSTALWAVLVCMLTVVAGVAAAGRLARVPPRLTTMIAVGTAVCGNTAIMAVAPVLDADEREVGFSVATITFVGTALLLVLPVLAHAVGMPDTVFGLWVGLAVNDTSQVVAAGSAYSDEAGQVATVVKLVRNTLMAPMILAIAWWVRRHQPAGGPDGGQARRGVIGSFPLFLFGFLALAALRSTGIISAGAADLLGAASLWCITIAIAAVGLGTRPQALRAVGLRPFLLGAGASAVLVVLGLSLARGISPG